MPSSIKPYIDGMRPIYLSSVVAAMLVAAPAVAQNTASVGDIPSFTLGEQTYNAMGKTNAESFRGKPTLIEYWGKN